MIFTIGLILTIVISFILFNETKKYEISDDSKIALFHLSFPFTEKHPVLAYVIFSSFLYFVWFSVLPMNLHFSLVFLAVLIMQMVVYIDLKCFRLPNKYVLPLIVASAIISPFFIGISDALLGGLIAFAITFVLGMIRFGGLGGGDAKFSVIVGCFIGMQYTVHTLALSFIIGGLFGFIYLFRKLVTRKDGIPYGPFFFLGFYIVFLWIFA